MCKDLSKFVLKVDMFGEPIALRLNKETTAKSMVGGIMSILLILMILSFFWYLTVDVVTYVNPRIAVEKEILAKRRNITLNKSTMPIAFGLTDEGTKIVDSKGYLTFAVSLAENKNSINGFLTYQALKFGQCERKDFPDLSEDTFKRFGLGSMNCLKEDNVTIRGFWDEDVINYISIQVKYCETSGGVECKPKSEINSFLNSKAIYMNIYLYNTAINPQNHPTPITKHLLNIYSGILSSFTKVSEINIIEQVLDSEDNLIFSLFKNPGEVSISYDFKEYDSIPFSNTECLIDYQLMSSRNRVTYHRTYPKITEVLADVGGFASVLTFVIEMICFVFATMKRDEIILNKIFDFDIESCKKEDKQKNNEPKILNTNFRPRNDLQINLKVIKPKLDSVQSVSSNEKENSENKNNQNISISDDQIHNGKFNNIRRKSIQLLHMINNKNSRPGSLQLFNVNFENLQTDGEKMQTKNKYLGVEENKDIINLPEIEEVHISENNIETDRRFSIEKRIASNSPRKRPKRYPSTVITESKNIDDYKIVERLMTNKESNYQLNFAFCEVFKIFFCRCCINKELTNKFKLYKISEKALDYTMDICYIIQKLEEFEKLKMVLLSKEQLALFNFISKDWCSLNDNKVQNSKFIEMKEFNKNPENLAKALVKFLRELGGDNNSHDNGGNNESFSKHHNEVNEKLLDFLHDDFKNNLLKED